MALSCHLSPYAKCLLGTRVYSGTASWLLWKHTAASVVLENSAADALAAAAAVATTVAAVVTAAAVGAVAAPVGRCCQVKALLLQG